MHDIYILQEDAPVPDLRQAQFRRILQAIQDASAQYLIREGMLPPEEKGDCGHEH